MTRLDDYNERRKLAAKKKTRKKRLPLPLGIFIQKIHGLPCRVCSVGTGMAEAHHIVDKKHFKPTDPTQHHPDNLMPLCERCHVGHTSQLRPVPWSALTASEKAFVETFRPQQRRQYR